MNAPHLPVLIALLLSLATAAPAVAQDDPQPEATGAKEQAEEKTETASKAPTLPPDWAGKMEWRCIGPANMGGRITALAICESDPTTWWAATASGGLLKTTDNGISFVHQFDREKTVSLGDVAVAPSDPKIVWVGTGESNPRNSVSWGNGVYKSIDGGSTWTHMGLDESFQIGRIAIHPADPDIVYVGALGRLYGPNAERGLFKTEDGGKTWKKILYVDENTGVIEVKMHPHAPGTLLVATYERQRDGFDTNDPAKRWGPGGGLHKTTDGGKTWKRITAGLPSGEFGRIGIDYYQGNPEIVFMVLESEKIGKVHPTMAFLGAAGEDAEVGARISQLTEDGPAAKAGLKVGDVVLKVGEHPVLSYSDLLAAVRRYQAGETVVVEISRERKHHALETTFAKVPDPKEEGREDQEGEESREARMRRFRQRGMRNPFGGSLGGQRQNMQDQQGSDGYEYGGVYKSINGGETWARVNSANPRPMYFSQIRVDPTDPDRVYVLGVSFYVSEDGGQNFEAKRLRGVHVDHHAMWIDPANSRHIILGNDGGLYVSYDRCENWDHLNHVAIGQFYHVGVGPRRDYRVYGGLQDNGSWGGPSRVRNGSGPTNSDWISVGGGDGFICRVDPRDPDLVYTESQNGSMGRRHLGTGERGGIRPRAPRGTRYRFNWQTPYILSHENSKIFYTAGNFVFRSLDRGEKLRKISPEITRTDRGSATALAESPRDPDVLYVGTDDGALWVTRNGGHDWKDLFPVAEPEGKKEEPIAAAGGASAAESSTDSGEEEPAGDAPATEEVARVRQEVPQEEPPARPRGGRGRGSFVARLMENDANGDGKIQKDEVSGRMASLFERVDGDGDGVLTKAEIEGMASRFGGRRGRGDRGGQSRGGDVPARGTGGGEAAASATAEPSSGKALADLMPGPRWVNRIEASRYADGRAYLACDAHRSDDDAPYIFVTEDFGESWRSIRGNLPDEAGTTRVVREDIENENLLYLGTEFGAWASIDRGETWTRLDLPTVAVHDFAIHPTAGEIVAATHGRSLWVLDVSVLRALSREAIAAKAHLYEPSPAILWRSEPRVGGTTRQFVGRNPPSGARISYSLGKGVRDVSLKITDQQGVTLRELDAEASAGLHVVRWDLRRTMARRGGRQQGPGASRFRGRGGRGGRSIRPGTVNVVLEVDGETFTQSLEVQIDPAHPDPAWLEYEEAAELLEHEEEEEGVPQPTRPGEIF